MPTYPLALRWTLEEGLAFLNHGSYGACPRDVLEEQTRWRARMERQPVQFFSRDLEGLLDEARAALAGFLRVDDDLLAFVPNATAGVNAVLRSLALVPGDELLITSQSYNACRNALSYVADGVGAKVVTVELPFPLAGPDEVMEPVLAAVTSRTKLALLDHIASPTGLVMPVARLVAALKERGVRTLIDGAHAPGQVPLELRSLGASYYVGNCHKWLFAPKGAGFLAVARELRDEVRPTVISHGANARRDDRSRFLLEFDWTGTTDPTAHLCLPAALRFGASLHNGGWPALMANNRALALEARALLCGALGVQAPCPEDMVGSLAAVPLPDNSGAAPSSFPHKDPLHEALRLAFHVEVPIIPWPSWPHRLVRISAQAYNEVHEYEALAGALTTLLSL
jgi:isopenicillin-N epimerase